MASFVTDTGTLYMRLNPPEQEVVRSLTPSVGVKIKRIYNPSLPKVSMA